MSEVKLRPSLWRTCRAIRNPIRLRLLKEVFEHDGEKCVSSLARSLEIEEPLASVYLRQLNARGLIGVARERIRVIYNTCPDRSLPESVKLQAVLRGYLAGELADGWDVELVRLIDAFSHPNRLAMLIRLARGPATIHQLTRAAGVVVKSIYHHLRFFTSAGLIACGRNARGFTAISLVPQTHPVVCTLLELTLAHARVGQDYRLEGPSHVDDATRGVLRKISAAEGEPRRNWKSRRPLRSPNHQIPSITLAHQEGS